MLNVFGIGDHMDHTFDTRHHKSIHCRLLLKMTFSFVQLRDLDSLIFGLLLDQKDQNKACTFEKRFCPDT